MFFRNGFGSLIKAYITTIVYGQEMARSYTVEWPKGENKDRNMRNG